MGKPYDAQRIWKERDLTPQRLEKPEALQGATHRFNHNALALSTGPLGKLPWTPLLGHLPVWPSSRPPSTVGHPLPSQHPCHGPELSVCPLTQWGIGPWSQHLAQDGSPLNTQGTHWNVNSGSPHGHKHSVKQAECRCPVRYQDRSNRPTNQAPQTKDTASLIIILVTPVRKPG